MSFFSTSMRAAVVIAATHPDPFDTAYFLDRRDFRDRDWLSRQPTKARKNRAQRIARRRNHKG